jgi:hypothetical protein
MKIYPVEAKLFYAGGRTGMTELIGTFRNFAKSAHKCLGQVFVQRHVFNDFQPYIM